MSLFTSEVTEKQIFDVKVKNSKKLFYVYPRIIRYQRRTQYEISIQDKSWFGKIGRRHLTKVLKELLSEEKSKIKCVGTPGNDESHKNFRINVLKSI